MQHQQLMKRNGVFIMFADEINTKPVENKIDFKGQCEEKKLQISCYSN